MLMEPKCFPSKSLEPIANNRIAAGFTHRNTKSGHIQPVFCRVKAKHSLADKTLAGKDFGKVPVCKNPL